MTKTVADVMKLVKEKECTFVDFRFVDTKGKEQHTTVPISAFDEDKFESGHALTVLLSQAGRVLKLLTCCSDQTQQLLTSTHSMKSQH